MIIFAEVRLYPFTVSSAQREFQGAQEHAAFELSVWAFRGGTEEVRATEAGDSAQAEEVQAAKALPAKQNCTGERLV